MWSLPNKVTSILGVLYISKMINSGGVMSCLSGWGISNIIFIIVKFLILLYLFAHNYHHLRFGSFIIVGGGMNLFDRLLFNGVFDYFYIDFFGWQTYIFNLADLYLMIGIILFLYKSYIR